MVDFGQGMKSSPEQTDIIKSVDKKVERQENIEENKNSTNSDPQSSSGKPSCTPLAFRNRHSSHFWIVLGFFLGIILGNGYIVIDSVISSPAPTLSTPSQTHRIDKVQNLHHLQPSLPASHHLTEDERIAVARPDFLGKYISLKEKEKKYVENSLPASEDPTLKLQTSKYALQLGSFRSRSKAEVFENNLKGKGYNAYVKKTKISKKGTWYRVIIGDYEDLEQVKSMAVNLQQQEGVLVLITNATN
jgi:cell division protein FtsN